MPAEGATTPDPDRLIGLRAAFRTGGEAGARMAATDWAATPLGPVETWPQSLLSTVSIMLASKAQLVIFWGPDHIALYNDTYAPTIGDKHPQALGRPAQENWAELWDILAPLLDGVLASGVAFAGSDHPFHIDRRGFLEDVWFDVSYDPVRVEDGSVGGVFCIVSETTSRVLNERRLTRLAVLDAALAHVTDPVGVVKAFGEGLGDAADVVPFTRFLPASGAWVDPGQLLGGTGELPEGVVLPDAVEQETEVVVAGEVRAVLVPLRSATGRLGTVALGVNPRQEFDDLYRRFLRFAAERLATALSTARAYEAEHRVAVTLQRAILPARLTRLGGVELDSVYLAATQGLDVGGDWFDALELDGGRVGLVIGDVAGKGVSAAALMAQMRNALRAYLLDDVAPADALGRLNRLMLRLERVPFATVICCVVDPAARTVRIANAGHFAPLLAPADGGEPRYLAAPPGPPIGVTTASQYAEVEHHLSAGDVLGLFTDGLVEERAEPVDLGLARAAAAVAGVVTAAEMLARLRALRETDERQDDIAVVTARLP